MNKPITIKNIIEVTNGKLICGNENVICEDFSKDTRELTKGQMYVGIKGENFNGSTLYEQALEKGACGCILQNVTVEPEVLKKYPNAIIIMVENTVTALQKMAAYKRSLYQIPVVAITGSVGKTSTKDMVASVLSQKYKVLKTEGNYNNEIGLPLTILKLRDEEAMVVEMGMTSLGEISLLTQIAKPDIAIITNVGTAHIEFLKTRENILKAKLEIIEGLSKEGTIIINNDNDLLHNWYQTQNTGYSIITYGLNEKSDIKGEEVQFHENGSNCKAIIEEKSYNVEIPVGGEHFVSNSLCALAVAKAMNIEIEKAIKGIANFELTKNRMQIQKAKIGATVINDCYNANYDSMKAALQYLGKLANQRKIAVLGDMKELGEYSQKLHEQVGEEVYKNKIDLLICVGEEAKAIAKKAQEQGMEKENIYLCENKEQAIKILNEKMQKEDAILIKASNSCKFIEICNSLCSNGE